MKNTYKFLLGLFAIGLISCEDSENGPLFLYGDLETGSYIRLVENSDILVDLDAFDDYTHTYTVEFVSPTQGSDVESYTADLVFKGSDTITVNDFVSLVSSDFSVNDDGFVEATISFTSADLLSAIGLEEVDLSPEDEFEFLGEIVTPSNTFNSVNSSATVEGAFFQGYFDFSLFVGCASDLEGEYTATTTSIICSVDAETGEETAGSESITYTLEIIDTGNVGIGEYEFSDGTFGVLEDCFGDGDGEDDEAQAGFIFTDICGVVSFSSVVDEFGTAWDFSSTISDDDWIITWSNPDSGLSGVTSINFPDGINFELE